MNAEELPVLDIRAVVKILNDARALEDKRPLKSKTISQFLVESKAGGRYAEHPFPPPDGRVGKSPVWKRGREQEFVTWDEGRVGQGRGGGRPRKPA
jgi:hypothetical protein